MCTTLPLDLVYPNTKRAAWASTDGFSMARRTDHELVRPAGAVLPYILHLYCGRLGISYDHCWLEWGPQPEQPNGCSQHVSYDTLMFFAISFCQRSRDSVKHSPLELLAYQSPDLWLTGRTRRVTACAWTGAHCAAVLCFHPGFLSCSILRCIAFGQASYSAL